MKCRTLIRRALQNRRGPVAPRRVLFGVVAVLGLALLLPSGSGSADPSSIPSLSITQLTPASQPAGTAFSYQVNYSCSNVNVVPCADNPTVTIPLGAAASWPVTVAPNALITSWSVTGNDLQIQLADLTEGVSGTIGITVTPPNHTTANNTSWSMKPTMTFTDATPSVTTTAVTSTATAQASLSVFKKTDQTYYHPGDVVTYRFTWDCPASGAAKGVEDLTTLKLVDTLPAGLTYQSSTPAGATVSGQTITFNLTAAQLGNACHEGAGTPVTVTIDAQIGASVADGTVIKNTVAATGTSISGATVTATSNASITVVNTFPAPVTSKSGYGPLVNSVGDGSYSAIDGGYYSATYPGAWLGRGLATDTASLITWNDARNNQIEAAYELRMNMPGPGLQASIVDPMPCTSNNSGANYSSNAPGTVCPDPAFHPTMVTVWAGTDLNAQNVGIPSAFVPQARLTNGTVIDLVAGPVPSAAPALASGPAYRSYYVPASAIGSVAELIFPRTAGMTNTSTTYAIGGYADANRVKGDVLRNQATIRSYSSGSSTPYATTVSSIGRIFVLAGPNIGIRKDWSGASSAFTLYSDVFLDRPTTGDLTFTDPLPAGISFTGPVTVEAYSSLRNQTSPVTAAATTSTDPTTGQTVLKVAIAAADINALLVPGKGDRLQFRVKVPVQVVPGSYTNTATVKLSDPRVDDSKCVGGTPVPGTSGAGFTCQGPKALTVNPTPTSDAVRVSKSVKGSLDAGFKTFPAIGHVAAAGGDATFRLSWTNKSAQTLGSVVAYDLLPHIGDTGTVAGTLNQQRGSTFTPTLTGIGTLPAGVTAYYSTAANPCRPEVLPDAQNPACTDTWTVLPASPSASLLGSVTALKFVSTATYTFDDGFAVDVMMTTPPLTSADEVAWNTFATGQTNTVTNQPVPPVESAKVGIARMDFKHISIDKVVDKTIANVGDTLTYTVKAINDGGRDLTNVTLRDELPPGATFVSASNGGVHSGGDVTWTLATMPLGQPFTFTITVKVATDGTTLVNCWGVDGDIPVDAAHPGADPDTSCATTHVPSVPLTFAKTSNPVAGTAVKPGDTVTYTVKVTNATPNTSTAGLVTDDMDGVLDHASLTAPPTLTCAPTANSCGKVTYAAGDHSFTWSSTSTSPMAGNTVASITYTVKIDEDATGTLHNVLVEPDVEVDHPIISWDKVVDKGANALVKPGDTLTYTISVTNTGTVDSAPFSVFDDLTNVVNKADFVAGSIAIDPVGLGAAAYDAATKHLTWTGSLDATQTVEVSYQVTVKADAVGELKNAFIDKQVVNPIAASLRWRKVGPDAQPLQGAEWKLWPVDVHGDPVGPEIFVSDCTQSPCSGTDTDPLGGRFLVTGLVPGSYRLVEVTAPDGYVLDGSPIAVEVAADAATTALADVVNDQQHGPDLPFAGGMGTDDLTIAGAVLLGLTAALAAWQRKRRRAV